MRRPISFTYIIIVTICSLMNIIALMPAIKAYEVLLRNWGGDSEAECCVWQEDAQRNFITYIPPNVPRKNDDYYCFSCNTFDNAALDGADLRNGILTQQTLDNTTTYWVDLGATGPDTYVETHAGGYNKDTCFHVFGSFYNVHLDEAPYEECQKIRDSK